MRVFLLIIGWASVIGCFGDALLALYAVYLTFANDAVTSAISVEHFLLHHVEFIYWVKHIAVAVLSDNVAQWLFSLPALIYFPVRIVLGIAISLFAFAKANDLDNMSKIRPIPTIQ